jgi:hypothetical protein
MKKTIFLTTFLVILGCVAHNKQLTENSFNEGFHTNGQAQAHNDDQKALLTQVKPFVSTSGVGLIDAAIGISDRMSSALQANALAITKLGSENIAANNVIVDKDKEIANWKSRYEKSQQEWGPKFQRIVERAIRIILLYLGIMLALRLVGALWIGPVGGVLSLIGTLMWPPSWFHSAADNFHFRGYASSLWSKLLPSTQK